MGVALTGDLTAFTGPSLNIGYRWFTDPNTRDRCASKDHGRLSRVFVSGFREVFVRRGRQSYTAYLANALASESEEFRAV